MGIRMKNRNTTVTSKRSRKQSMKSMAKIGHVTKVAKVQPHYLRSERGRRGGFLTHVQFSEVICIKLLFDTSKSQLRYFSEYRQEAHTRQFYDIQCYCCSESIICNCERLIQLLPVQPIELLLNIFEHN